MFRRPITSTSSIGESMTGHSFEGALSFGVSLCVTTADMLFLSNLGVSRECSDAQTCKDEKADKSSGIAARSVHSSVAATQHRALLCMDETFVIPPIKIETK